MQEQEQGRKHSGCQHLPAAPCRADFDQYLAEAICKKNRVPPDGDRAASGVQRYQREFSKLRTCWKMETSRPEPEQEVFR